MNYFIKSVKPDPSHAIRFPQLTAREIRDTLHNLDPDKHDKIYKEKRYIFIANNEGGYKKSYDDTNNKRTVGIGFNMDRGDKSLDEWNKAFSEYQCEKHNIKKPDFALVREGEQILTEKQVIVLFEAGLEMRAGELSKQYGSTWKKLRLNEKLMIEDAYFNGGGALVGKYNDPRTGAKRETRFMQNILKYYQTNDKFYLEQAINEIKHKSNSDKVVGLRKRRDKEAVLLNSSDCRYYSKPHEPRLVEKPVTVLINHTIIPLGSERWEIDPVQSMKFFIWRTKEDDRVRATHQKNDGKVFFLDNPPDDFQKYNCRCIAMPVPSSVTVVEISGKNYASLLCMKWKIDQLRRKLECLPCEQMQNFAFLPTTIKREIRERNDFIKKNLNLIEYEIAMIEEMKIGKVLRRKLRYL